MKRNKENTLIKIVVASTIGLLIFSIVSSLKVDVIAEPAKVDIQETTTYAEERQQETVSEQDYSEPEVPPEPEKVEVEYFNIGGTQWIKCEQAELSGCGLTLIKCSDNYNWYCLKEIKSETKLETIAEE